MYVGMPPFKMAAPQGWTMQNLVFAGPISSSNQPANPTFHKNLFMNSESLSNAGEVDLEEYVQRQLEALQEMGLFGKLIKDPTALTLKSKIAGFVYEYTLASPEDGLEVQQIQFVTQLDHTIYTFTWSDAPGKYFEESREHFTAMLDSLAPIA